MNIFIVDTDPKEAARVLPDKHVTKMILESAQMLSMVFSPHYWDIGIVSKVDGTPFKTAKGAFKKHPCTIWAAEKVENCAWLIEHAVGLCIEFDIRYDKLHNLTDVTSFARAMPEYLKFDTTIDDVEAYRRYVNTKEWVCYNYLRRPDRKPDWVQPISN